MQLKRTGMEKTTLMNRPWESKYCWRLKDCQFFAAYWLMVSEERTVSSNRKNRTAWVVWWFRVITVNVVRKMWNTTRPISHPSLQSICIEKNIIKNANGVILISISSLFKLPNSVPCKLYGNYQLMNVLTELVCLWYIFLVFFQIYLLILQETKKKG